MDIEAFDLSQTDKYHDGGLLQKHHINGYDPCSVHGNVRFIAIDV